MNMSIILSVIGPDKPGVVSDISEIVQNHLGNIEKSRMIRLGDFFTIMVLITINKNHIKNLDYELNNYSQIPQHYEGYAMTCCSAGKFEEAEKALFKTLELFSVTEKFNVSLKASELFKVNVGVNVAIIFYFFTILLFTILLSHIICKL